MGVAGLEAKKIPDRTTVGLRMLPALKQKLEMAAAARGEFNYVVLEEALEAYFSNASAGESARLAHHPAVKDLQAILTSGDTEAIELSAKLLKGIRGRLRPAAQKET